MQSPWNTRPGPGRIIGLAARTALLALLCLCTAAPALAEVPHLDGWTRVFSDDFNGPAGQLPSTQRWKFDIGTGWGTHEIESYTDNPRNIHVDGKGHLRIVALRDAAGMWTSARIETRQDDFAAPPHGVLRVQASLRFPVVSGERALGYWPAFWLLPASFRKSEDWPAVGEIDIAENVNGIDRVWGTMHCGVNPGGPCHEKAGLSANRRCPGTTCQSGFHTYAFEWDRSVSPEQLRWYVDGKLYHTIRRSDLPAATWDKLTLGKGMFVLINMAMGGDFPDRLNDPVPTPTPRTEPGHAFVVDYVGVWTRKGSR